MPKFRGIYILTIMTLIACQPPQPEDGDIWLDHLLNQQDGIIESVIDDAEKYGVQILYTQIDRDRENIPFFTSYRYRVNANEYFYPASTVKMPAAILALEKLRQIGIPPQSNMLTYSASPLQTTALLDSTSRTGFPNVENYIRKIFLVSDNDAFNRLYEFLGQADLNEFLWDKGYTDTRIVHRLSIFLSQRENRLTNPIRFVNNKQLVFEQPALYNERPIVFPHPILKGKGEMIDDSLVMEPKDFSVKNNFPLEEQQRMLRALIFPQVAHYEGFDLEESDYELLYLAMSQLPIESDYPAYDPNDYDDSYVKFLLFGDTHTPLPRHIRIFNKIGMAYGYLTDNAYIVDLKNELEFFLSATIYVNENQIFNDGNYEYKKTGLPFMQALGELIYEYEKNRKRTHIPDLSRFRLKYSVD